MSYAHTKSRVLQYIGIILIIGVFAGAYWYFQVFAGVKTNTSLTDPLSEGLAGYWKLDDGSGTSATDSSANGNTGTLTNGPTWATGQIGGAVDFDGTDDYITASVPSLGTAYTASAWIKSDTVTGNLIFFSNRSTSDFRPVAFQFDHNGSDIRFIVRDDAENIATATYAAALSIGQWTHVVGVRSGNTITLYVNGIAATAASATFGTLTPNSMNIGAAVAGSAIRSNFFNGVIDETRIYNRALSTEEVTQLYRVNSPTGVDTNLKGYWTFDGTDISGTTTIDRSGTGNTSTLSGSPTITEGKVGQALSFDGTDDYVQISGADISAPCTMSIWTKPSARSTTAAPLFAGTGSYSSFRSEQHLSSTYAAGITSTAGADYVFSSPEYTAPLNTWTHLVAVVTSSSAATLYANGVQQGSISGANLACFRNRIGVTVSGDFLRGSLDEPRVYNTALTAAQIQSLYRAGESDVMNVTDINGNLNSGLAGYWAMNEGTGTSAKDSSINGTTGTLTGGPTWTTGQVGGAVDFDGTDDYINLGSPAALDIRGSITMSAWVKTDVLNTTQAIFSVGTRACCGTENYLNIHWNAGGGTYRFLFGSFGVASVNNDSNISAGVWYHVVGTWDGATRKIYINGVLAGSAAQTTPPIDYLNAVIIGGGEAGNGPYFNGSIDETRIYNRALSDNEVAQLYRYTGPAAADSGLVGHWSFNGTDTTATKAYDRSGTGNTGTLTNSPTIAEGKVGQGIAFSSAGTQVVTVPYAASLNPTSTMSLSAWIKTGSAANNKYILNRDATTTSGYGFFLGAAGNPCTTTGVIGFTIGATTNELCSAGPNLGDSLWHHVVAVYDGTTASLYVDGTLNTSGSLTNSLNNATSPLWIGTNSTGNRGFDGSIDEVRIYNTVLTAAQIQSLYKAGESDTMNVMDRNGNLNNGLAGYWKLDEGSGTSAVDSSINGSTGTLTNGPTWGAGQVGGAATFDGVNDYVTAGTASALNFTTNTFAISAWIYPTAIPAQNQAVYHDSIFERWDHGCTGHGYAFRLTNAYTFNAPTELELNVNCGSATGTTLAHGAAGVLVNNQWQHVVAVINAGVVTFYINGTPYAATGNITENPTTYGGPATIGSDSTGTGNPFTGSIDEVRVYSRAITANEVAQLYRYTAPAAADSGLAGYWSFNGTDMTSTKAYDRSGAGNTGTLTNGPTVTEGRLGQGLLFDGVDDYVTGNITNVPMGNTMAVWFKIDNVTGNKVIFSHDDNTNSGQRLQLSGSTFQFTLGGVADYSCGFSAATANTWYFFAAATTGNGGTVTCYLGQENGGFTAGSPSAIGTRGGTPTKFNIGRLPSTGTPFGGKIDEARLYNRALTTAEITSLYNASK